MSGDEVDWKAVRRELLQPSPRPEVLHPQLQGAAQSLLARAPHGDLPGWMSVSQRLRQLAGDGVEEAALESATVRLGGGLQANTGAVREALLQLSPWRKGPFEVAGVNIDAEWRSNLKWDRVQRAVDFSRCSVLDVGCGNGYYGYRAVGAGACCVVGIDPTPLYVMQFEVTRHFARKPPLWVLPLRLEDLPKALSCFDITLSMGVLYHRPSPFEHLRDLRLTLKPGGTLVLETLVIEGGPREVWVPEGRYAGMRNVYFLPSCAALQSWLRRAGFEGGQVVDLGWTSVEEQRATPWSQGQSLVDFLDSGSHRRTVEGEPAPLRAVLVARRPVAT